jgi:hypothetical protein
MARPEKVADFFDKGMPKKKGRPKKAALSDFRGKP